MGRGILARGYADGGENLHRPTEADVVIRTPSYRAERGFLWVAEEKPSDIHLPSLNLLKKPSQKPTKKALRTGLYIKLIFYPITIITSSLPTLSPADLVISSTFPLTGEGILFSIFIASSTKTTSPALTWSPTLTL